MHHRILTSRPINKAASVVTNQSGCVDEVSLVQERQYALARVNQLVATDSKRNGKEIQNLGLRIAEINAAIKEKRRSANMEMVNQEWQEFAKLVAKEIGYKRAMELKTNAESLARSWYAQKLSECKL